MPGDPLHPIARRVRAAREFAKLSRDGLGSLLGMSGATIGRWERGDWESEPPNVGQLQLVARHTGVPEWFMLGGFEAGHLQPNPLTTRPAPMVPAEDMAEEALDALARPTPDTRPVPGRADGISE